MDIAQLSGYLAAVLVFLTFYMRTMIPLRVVGIASNCAFILYGVLGSVYPILILHLALLPLNSIRLMQMVKLSRDLREATRGDLSLDWIKPFATSRQMTAGETIFNKGDAAAEMFLVMAGRCRLVETGLELRPGDVVGEFPLVTAERVRTQTLTCIESGRLLRLGYAEVEQVILQHPSLGFYFLKLITRRLMQNNARLEQQLAGMAVGPPARPA
jgi:hypothetical protein